MTDFPKSRSTKDGLFHYCRPCTSARRAGRREAERRPRTEEERARRAAQARAWYAANKDRARETQRRYCDENREQINSRRRVVGAKYRATKDRSMPGWADEEAIRRFYVEAELLTRLTGETHHVDHIVPLHGRTVCGLHVQNNLRVVTADYNRRKGNRLNFRG